MRNIKLISIFVSLLLSFTFIFSCVSNNSQNSENNESTETGYPTKQVQKTCIFYNDVVWIYDAYNLDAQCLNKLPEDVTLIGKTLYENSYQMPCQNFHTSHIDVGRNVYIDSLGEAIYIERQGEETIYYRYVPIEE